MKKLSLLAVAASMATSSMLLLSSPVNAEAAKSERQAANAVQFRQALLQLVRSNMGPLGGMARGQIPMDVEVVKTNSERLEQLSVMLPDYFATDTTAFSVETEALPKIWSNMDDYLSKANDLTVASQALQVAAATGNEGAIRKAIGKVGGTCKACHDAYKAE